jgi:asparagine synthase (glutamine-hydrolysing)
MPPFKFTFTEPEAQQKSLHLPIEKQLEYDYFNGRMVSDYLRKSDMMSMLNSIEFRVPMLDEDLTQYSLNIPAAYKSDRNTTKKILRTLHARLFPSELSKLKKRGFTIPLDTWLGAEHLQTMQQIIMQSSIVKEYVHEEYISYLFQSIGKEDAYTSRAGVYQKILILYSLAIWHQQYNSLKN